MKESYKRDGFSVQQHAVDIGFKQGQRQNLMQSQVQKNQVQGKIENRLEKSRTRPNSVTRVISFTSGKGGVGKTNTVVNLAVALAREGKSVLILDADLGLANINVLFGLEAKNTIFDVIEGRKDLEEIMLDGPEGVSIIPAASGIESVSSLSAEQRMLLMHSVENVAYSFDYLLIDTQAGIGEDVIHFNCASSEITVVINPEPTSLTDAYALIKVLSKEYGEKEFSVVANNVPDEAAAKKAFRRLSQAVDRFLHVELKYIGFVPADAAVNEAIGQQRSLMEVYPSSTAALALARVARRIDSDFYQHRVKGGMQFFFQQLLEMGVHG